jgi:phosphoribosylanthranilate isomerase
MNSQDASTSAARDSRGRFFKGDGLKVKFCGITTGADAALAVASGADAIGINFYEGSKRHVSLQDASEWLGRVEVTRVAVVVNAKPDQIEAIAASGVLDAIQFHGDESPELCAACPLPWIRAVRVESARSLDESLAYGTDFILLDAFSAQGYGGTGHRLDWNLAAEFVAKNPGKRVIVAGGLTAETVGQAVRLISPFGVDVASGIELEGSPRSKSGPLMKAFRHQADLFAKSSR